MEHSKNPIRRTVMTGVMAALLAVMSQISIPLPVGVPITLQTFAVALCGYLMGPALGTLAVVVYLALAAVGVPVLAGFSGGVGAFMGMTGGFLWGFIPMALLCGLGVRAGKKYIALLLGGAGLLLCHLAGSFQFGLVSGTSFFASVMAVSVPFLIKDAVSVVLAYLAAAGIAVSLKKAGMGDLARGRSEGTICSAQDCSLAAGITRPLRIIWGGW